LDTATRLLASLSSNPQLLEQMKKNAREKVTDEYRTDQFAENILTALTRAQNPALREPEI
jgi:hypothetical protein